LTPRVSAGILRPVITVRLNDLAVRGVGAAPEAVVDLPGINPGELLHRLTSGGLARDERGGLFVPGLSFNVPDFADLTYRECQRNSWHLDDHPEVQVNVDENGTPHIADDDQVRMLRNGIVLSRAVREMARALPDQPSTCCIIAANSTNGTFRFHQLRQGESWIGEDLDAYLDEMIIVVEDRPSVLGSVIRNDQSS
jgi:hypothetical protein